MLSSGISEKRGTLSSGISEKRGTLSSGISENRICRIREDMKDS